MNPFQGSKSLKFFAITLLFISVFTQAQDTRPLYPEDGSMRLGTWNTTPRGLGAGVRTADRVKQALQTEGVRLNVVDYPYTYFQDISLFDESGAFVTQAPYPDDPELLLWLTMDLYEEYMHYHRISQPRAQELGFKFGREMKITFVEGGDLITGRFKDGTPYAITPWTTVARAALFAKISREEAHPLVAKDLGVSPENLFIVTTFQHLDLHLAALPGGTLLLSDPRQLPKLISEIKSDPATSESERKNLELVLQAHPKSRENNDWNLKLLDEMETFLSQRFRVIRVPGVFPSANHFTGFNGVARQTPVNFFNHIVGKNALGELFVLTGSADGNPSLERHWRKVLQNAAGINPERVHFVATGGDSNGLDCAGAPSP